MTETTLTFDSAGHLVLDFGGMNGGFREAVCPKCDEPIRWVLDMASFTAGGGPRMLAHARCVWKRNAFTTERRRAVPDDD